MANWRMSGEPPLEELLEDEVMVRVMIKAGLDPRELRHRLAELARRLELSGTVPASQCCGTGFR